MANMMIMKGNYMTYCAIMYSLIYISKFGFRFGRLIVFTFLLIFYIIYLFRIGLFTYYYMFTSFEHYNPKSDSHHHSSKIFAIGHV